MSDYELYHASTRKHKYIKKIGNRYFYTQQEIAAYLKGKKGDVTFEKSERPDYSNGGDGSPMKDYRLDFNKEKGTYTYTDSKGKKHTEEYTMSDGVGVRVGNKRIQVYNTTNKAYEKNPDVKGDNKGRFRREYAEDGSMYTLDYSDRKTYRKRQRKEVEQAKNFSNSLKEWGVDNRAAEADYRSKKADLDRAEAKDAKRAARKKRIKKEAHKTVKSMKRQAAKGKKALDRWNKKRAPRVTVVQSISEDKNYKRQNGQRG